MSKSKLSLKQWIYYFVFLLALQEIVFRIIFPIPEVSNFDRAKYTDLRDINTEANYWRNTTYQWESSLDTQHIFDHSLNLYGFRDENWYLQKPEGKQRILFVGDSFVEGVMTKNNEQLTDYFKKLDTKDEYEVLNAGMAGVGLSHELQLVSMRLPCLGLTLQFCVFIPMT